MRTSLFAVVVLVGGLLVPASGQEVKLAWKFEKGKPFYQEMNTVTNQTMKLMGMDVTQKQNQTFYFSWTPVEQTKDGGWVIEQEIVGVKMSIEIAGNKIEFDSTKDGGANNPLADFFKALVGSKFKLTLKPDMTVEKIEGREEFVKKLVSQNQAMQPLLNAILSEDALKQMADPAFAAVPNKPVKKGDTWEKKSTLNMGPIGSYETTYKYTYDGVENNLHKIKVDTALKYTPPAANAGAGLPFTIKEANLASKEAGGTILFNNDKGRVESSDMKLKLDGTMKIEVGGTTSDVTLSQQQSTTVKSSDTNPIKK